MLLGFLLGMNQTPEGICKTRICGQVFGVQKAQLMVERMDPVEPWPVLIASEPSAATMELL